MVERRIARCRENVEGCWRQISADREGEKLWAALKAVAKESDKDDKLLDRFTIPPGVVIAPDLKAVIESAMSLHSPDTVADSQTR
jgi:hypothetical protein